MISIGIFWLKHFKKCYFLCDFAKLKYLMYLNKYLLND